MTPLTLDELIAGVCAESGPHETVFWTGAGISIDPPANLASGAELTTRTAERMFEPDLLARIRRYYRRLEISGPDGSERTLPRLEFLLDVAYAAYGRAAFDVIDDLASFRPNWFHSFYAAHLGVGGAHVTANFDLGIERAMRRRTRSDRLVHIHGEYDARSPERLGATIQRVERGFEPELRDRLRAMLLDARLLVVGGYSGSDFFDVDPFIEDEAAAGRFGRLTVIWVDHADAVGRPERVLESSVPMAASFARAGVDVWWTRAPTRLVHERFSSAWGLDVPAVRGADGAPLPVRTHAPPSDVERAAASLRLWSRMGVPEEVDRLLPGLAARVPAELEIEAAAASAWNRGRYSDARRIWMRRNRADPHVDLHVRERIGATLWASGRLIPAFVVLTRAIRRGDASGLDTTTARETRGRTIEHMGRTPELWLLHRLLARWLASQLPDESIDHPIGMRTRVAEARRVSETGRPDFDKLGAILSTWRETEDLAATLNHRHRLLRDRHRDGQRPSCEEYRRLCDQLLAIGSTGDAARIATIPGAERAFSAKDVRRLLGPTQFAPWQRCRIFAAHALRRTVGWLVRKATSIAAWFIEGRRR